MIASTAATAQQIACRHANYADGKSTVKICKMSKVLA